MLKKNGLGSGSPSGAGGPGKTGKVEAGMAEINNSLCKAMFGLVLSEEALR